MTPPRPEALPAAAENLPPGFSALPTLGGFIAANGPLYLRHEGDRVQLGFRVEARHVNPLGVCHGGMLATFCDMLVPLSIRLYARSDR